MTIELAIDYIRRRMEELGHGDQYYLRFRHFVLQGKQAITIEAGDQLFILVEPMGTVSIESSFGIYDLTISNTNELQYEHQGHLTLTNYTGRQQHVRFIQVIPKNI
jgi:hypothetical protein